MKKIILLCFLYTLAAGYARAQFSATLAGYPLVTTGWNVGANATVVDSTIQLTPPAGGQNGYVYYNTPVDLTGCGQFTVKFDFRIKQYLGTSVADGIAFWYISNPPSGFASGGGIGLPSNPNGLLMIMDTYDNTAPVNVPLETLLGYNGTIAGYVEGSTAGLLCPVNSFQYFIDDGTWHHCEIDYNVGNVNVYFNYSTTPSQTGYYPMSIAGYFGFSSSTGAAYSTQSVKNIHITALGSLSAPTVTSPVNYCVGATAVPLSATAGTGGTLKWYTTDTATVISLPGAPTPSTATAGTTTWYVRQTSGTCISPPDSITVIVSPPPGPPTVTDPSPYCQGDVFVPFTITTVPGASAYWYPTAAGGTGTTTAPVTNTAVPGTYTYYYNQATGTCESSIDSIKITVNPAPAAISGAADVCQYFSITLSDGTAGGTWSSSNTVVATISTAGVVSGIAPGATAISYKLSATGCAITKLVTVHAKPAKPTVTPPTYCQYAASAQLTGTPATGLLWYGPGTTAATFIAPTPSTSTAGVTDYYVTETSTFGCVSDSATDVVTIVPQPAPPVVRDSAYCDHSFIVPLNYQADSAAGSHLNWYTAASGGSAFTGAPTPADSIVTFPFGSSWYVSQTVNGCESNRVQITDTVVNLPDFSIASSKGWVCQHDTMTLSYSSTVLLAIATYHWQLPQGVTIVTGSIFAPSIVVRFDSAYGPQSFSLNVSELNHKCVNDASLTITVIAQPYAHGYMIPNVCEGDTVDLALADEAADATAFGWYIDGTPLFSSPKVNIIAANSNSGGPYSVSWNDSGIHYITVTATTNEGCRSVPTYDTVEVHPLPDAAFTFKPKTAGTLCLEDSVLFMAATVNYNDMYLWQPTSFFGNDNKPQIWGKVDLSKSDIVLTVMDPFGCRASTTQQIDPSACCTILFPSAFTPNGDGKNDHFRPIATGYHRFHSFRVVNRWGQTVFESSGTDPEWDGNYNGVPQDLGVYYYFVKYDCGGNTLEQKGDCTLVR